MIRSMTGFGQGTARGEGVVVTVDLRSVNHRFADARVRLPSWLATAEVSIRRRILARVARGRADASVNVEREPGAESGWSLDRGWVEAAVDAAKVLREEFGIDGDLDVARMIAHPEALKPAAVDKHDPERTAGVVLEAVDHAIAAHDEERLREGGRLAEEIVARVDGMRTTVSSVREAAAQVPERARARLLERLDALAPGLELDPVRLAQEATFAADRSDITEELVRLESHLDRARALLASPDGEPVGKRLDFLVQEIHREVNTIGSKVGDLDIGRAALDLKTETEKIREQVQNLE